MSRDWWFSQQELVRDDRIQSCVFGALRCAPVATMPPLFVAAPVRLLPPPPPPGRVGAGADLAARRAPFSHYFERCVGQSVAGTRLGFGPPGGARNHALTDEPPPRLLLENLNGWEGSFSEHPQRHFRSSHSAVRTPAPTLPLAARLPLPRRSRLA
jgi:hypothetical protein